MTLTDPVADFLTRLRNAMHAEHQEVLIPASSLKRELARILADEGYISSYELVPARPGSPGGEIKITLKYSGGRMPVISGIERVSRPGRRTYVDHAHIPRVHGGMGTAIISTSEGIMTGHEARRRGIGGEVMARVW